MISDQILEKKKRKKEIFLIVAILVAVVLLTIAEMRVTDLGNAIPISNAVLMFILINTNLLLLLALILLVFRNLAKLYYEKKNNILGTRFKTKLVAAFITLSLVPTSVLFFFSIHFISASLAFWFNAPVEQTLDNSLSVGRQLYRHMEEKNLFFGKQAAEHIASMKNLYIEDSIEHNSKSIALTDYLSGFQDLYGLHAVEFYTTDARRFALSISSELDKQNFGTLTSDELMQIPFEKSFRSITEESSTGELIRTIISVPFASKTDNALGFLVMTTMISPELSTALASISRGVEEYQQLTLLKRPVEVSNYIALSIVALLVVFCAVWFGFYLAKSITIPIMMFAEGTQRVTQGDLSYTIDFKADDELATLIESFNSMTRELATGRAKLARSRELMQQQNRAIEESRQYMEIVLKNISAGVISVDKSGVITTINKAAETLLYISASEILGNHYLKVLKGEHLKLAEKISKELPAKLTSVEFPLTVSIGGTPRYFSTHFNALKNDRGENVGTVMVFDDMTEIEKAQRMVAWREVARRIAHEVKNPLTPIKLSAQRLKRKYSGIVQEEVFDQCTQTIVEHVDLIRNLVNEFSTFAKFPDTRLLPCRIEKIAKESIALYQDGLESVDIRFSQRPADLPEMQLDRQQMKQAFINLLDNAVAAVNKKGIITIDISYDTLHQLIRIEVADNGKGIPDSEKTKLFEPYFSTKKSGMGLGLAIVNSIITGHKGMIRVQDNKPAGAKFIIELPVES
ncbi:putative nitrogen regulation protein (PAS/PAC domain protein) [Desulfamplus magnetovallimortis]|uniref:histidine kinase n=1 Tax=Desulfamplus magnetovallimortis TaxID=1246637 RepID=A0A1W1H7C6_9BACT|nr:ATP-binding protein [Desulfamplus magnetovallimortis]SLM28285.1 putative nitrogen regulation protein (PAS/PAC domain protein) [Desulfamplus magnetovallimortis]